MQMCESFSDQLDEIRKVSLSSVLCNNNNGMTTISPKAMELEGESNTRISCSQVAQMNLDSWKVHNVEQGMKEKNSKLTK